MVKDNKNRVERILAALLSVFIVLYFLSDNMGRIGAVRNTYDITAHTSSFEIIGDSINVKVNGKAITSNGTAVKTGDKFLLDFKWKLKDNANHNGDTFVYDLTNDLKGITIPDNVFESKKNGVVEATYAIENNVMSITIGTDTGVNYTGGYQLQGTFNLSDVEEYNDGEFKVKFADKEILFLNYDALPRLEVGKSASGSVNKIDGKLYQNFSVTVKNTSSSVDAPNTTLTDTHGQLFKNGTISNVLLDGSTVPVSSNGNSDTVNLGTIAKGASKTLTYTLEIDPSAMLWGDWVNNNSVKAVSGKASGWAWAKADITLPSISKTASLSEDKSTISWVITVKPGYFEDTGFSVTDTPDPKLFADGYTFSNFASEIGLSAESENTLKIDKSNFTNNGDGTYTYEYNYEKVNDYVLKEDINVSIGNNAVLKIPGVGDLPVSSNVIVPASNPTNHIYKYHDAVTENKATGEVTIPWVVEVNIPEDAKSISVNDSTTNSEIDISSVVVIDGNGTEYRPAANNGYQYVTGLGGLNLETGYCNFNINDQTFIEANKGKTIKIKLNSVIKDANIQGTTNKASLTITKTDGTPIENEDNDEYVRPITVAKSLSYDWDVHIDDIKNPNYFEIKISNLSGTEYSAGDKIKVIDSLPEGYELVDSKLKVIYGSGNTLGYVLKNTGNQFEVEITLDQASAQAFTNNTTTLNIIYASLMTDEYYIEFNNDPNVTQNGKELINKCSVRSDAGSSVSECKFYVYTSSQKIINKYIDDKDGQEGQRQAADGQSFSADYRIDINEGGAQLGNGTNITVIDRLGSALELDVNSIVINEIKNYQSSDVTNTPGILSYNSSAKTITFNLKDKTQYAITYKVNGTKMLNDNELSNLDNPDVVEELEKRYGNTVEINSGSNIVGSSSAAIDASTFRYKGSISWEFSIKGTKSWTGDGDKPDEITFILTELKKPLKGDVISTEYTYHLSPEYTSVSVNGNDIKAPIIVENGNWTFTIRNLKRSDEDGAKYTYKIKEADDPNYSVTYMHGGDTYTNDTIGSLIIDSDSNSTFDLSIINKFKSEEDSSTTTTTTPTITPIVPGYTGTKPVITTPNVTTTPDITTTTPITVSDETTTTARTSESDTTTTAVVTDENGEIITTAATDSAELGDTTTTAATDSAEPGETTTTAAIASVEPGETTTTNSITSPGPDGDYDVDSVTEKNPNTGVSAFSLIGIFVTSGALAVTSARKRKK